MHGFGIKNAKRRSRARFFSFIQLLMREVLLQALDQRCMYSTILQSALSSRSRKTSCVPMVNIQGNSHKRPSFKY